MSKFKVWYKNKRYFLVVPVLVFGLLFLLLHWNTAKLQSTSWVILVISGIFRPRFPHTQLWTILVFVGTERFFKIQFG